MNTMSYFLQKFIYPMDPYQKRRINTTRIDINSKYRNKKDFMILDNNCVELCPNPLVFVDNGLMLVKYNGYKCFDIGDKIMIRGAVPRLLTLRSYISKGKPAFEIPSGCNFMKIYCQHEIPLSFDTDIIIKLSDVKGDRGTNNNISFLGSVPINLINGEHKVYLTLKSKKYRGVDDDYFKMSHKYFFIVLPTIMHCKEKPYELEDYNFKLMFDSICGVPIKDINKCHEIVEVCCDGLYVRIPFLCSDKCDSKSYGGNVVSLTKVGQMIYGYSEPNNYTVDLQNVFRNVISVQMVSCEIPNTAQIINCHCNKIYWYNLDDGEYLYSVCVIPGNYTAKELERVINKELERVDKISGSNIMHKEILGIEYTCKNYMKVSIDDNNGQVIFSSLNEFVLRDPFECAVSVNDGCELFICHPNHCVDKKGSFIRLCVSDDFMGIPKDVISGDHVITKIIDKDKYVVKINYICSLKTKGTKKIKVLVYLPNMFKLVYKKDSMMSILGFDKCDTNYGYIIRNNCQLNLFPPSYMLMVIDQCNTFYTLGKIKNAFAKIQLSERGILFNTFVPMFDSWDNPLKELSELGISFYWPNGKMVDFFGLDHSFTLEITTVNDIPINTEFNANTGKNYDPVIATEII